MPSLGLHQDSFDSRKRAVLDSHSIANLQEQPRFARESCTVNCLESFDLLRIDRSRELGAADDVLNAGNNQDRQAIINIKWAEQVPRKQRRFNFLNSVGPTSP